MGNNKKKRKRKKSPVVIICSIAIVLVVIGALALMGLTYLRYIYNRSNYIADMTVTLDTDYVIYQQEENPDEEVETTMDADMEESLASFNVVAQSIVDNAKSDDNEDNSLETYNLLLVGSDRRSNNWNGNSDVMILLTINDATKKIYMTSFMRDLYAYIDGVGVRKMNSSYALGGGPLLVQTLQSNYGVAVDNYAAFDFNSAARVIDMFGGAYVHMDQAEAEFLSWRDHITVGTGDIVINGEAAVNYARIRYIGASDFERTARQREILSSLFNSAKSVSLTSWPGIASEIASMITHNISAETLAWMATQAPSWMGYELVQLRVPFDGYYTSQNEILIPDFDYTINTLRSTIYATE